MPASSPLARIAYPIVCGNTVVFRGSELSPRSHQLIAEVFHEAGLPGRCPQLHHHHRGGRRRRRRTRSSPTRPFVASTSPGSTRVGRIIAQKSAAHLKPCLLELGGKAPFVVLDDADIDGAVNAAVFGSFLFQGQICMSTERFVVDESVADEFVSKFAGTRIGAWLPATRSPTRRCVVGPMVTPASGDRINDMIDDAVAKGADMRGGRPGRRCCDGSHDRRPRDARR